MRIARPLVDLKVHALADAFMSDYVKGEPMWAPNPESMDDLVWDLADEIQHVIEAWITDAVQIQRIQEKRR